MYKQHRFAKYGSLASPCYDCGITFAASVNFDEPCPLKYDKEYTERSEFSALKNDIKRGYIPRTAYDEYLLKKYKYIEECVQ